MVETAIFCDRCGKRCTKYRDSKGFNLIRKKYFVKPVGDDNYLDLCQSCYDELVKFMKSEKVRTNE